VAINRTVIRRDARGNVMDRAGNKYMRSTEREILEVVVDRGAYDGQKIVFDGKGDIQEGMRQGDVVLVVKVGEHPVFKRKGADLVLEKEVTLLEAIAGVAMSVRGVSGEVVNIRSPPGMVIKPGALLEVPDLGMPVAGHTQVRGSLIIKFDVAFPERLDITEGMRKILAGVLKSPPSSAFAAAGEEGEHPLHELQALDVEAREQREHLARESQEEEEEEGGGGQPGVQCAHQ
jgi:DnaJ-class molecular chaperone